MLLAPFPVVLDANVLFPFTLRDTLLRAAEKGLYRLHWTERILDELTKNLVHTGHATFEQATRLRHVMARAFPEASVEDYEPLEIGLTNDPKDRHVVAAALKCGAQVIVTANLADFAPLPYGLEAQSPDDFLCSLFELDPTGFRVLLEEQSQALRNPPISYEDLLVRLAKVVPCFVDVLSAREPPT